MRWFVLVAALGAAACQSTRTPPPAGHAETLVHEEYDAFRPVSIAVLPVHAPNSELKNEVRAQVYRMLFEQHYSPFTLRVVDAHIDLQGQWDPSRTLDWDATLAVDIHSWKAVRGSDRFAADGEATLRHRSGEILWSCKFEQHAFDVPSHAGDLDQKAAARDIAAFLVGPHGGRLPTRPPLPRE